MPVNVNQQTIIFFACIVTGLVSGLVFDILNITAKKMRFNKSAFFVQDIIIWFIILAFFFTVIYKINGAVLRWYVFLGALFGTFFYLLLIRKTVIAIVTNTVDFIWGILWKTARILLFPLKKMSLPLKALVKYVQVARKKKNIFVQKNIEKLKRIKVLLNKV